jgi:hypothetical protein
MHALKANTFITTNKMRNDKCWLFFQVILSSLPWHEIFYRLLNRAAEITHHSPDDGELLRFLDSTYNAKIPEYGSLFHVTWRTGTSSSSDFSFLIPHHFSLPSIPDNVRN